MREERDGWAHGRMDGAPAMTSITRRGDRIVLDLQRGEAAYLADLPDRLHDLRGDDGERVFDGPTVAALLVFFVYALQCLSTVAVLRRETNSWRWPLTAVGSMFVLAYVGGLVAHALVAALA